MKPLKLTMQAFGSYGKKTCIDFGEVNQNLFLITGDTGAGKTTIFDAIVFALYGEASSTNNKKDGMELQSQFVSFETEPYVELTFSEFRGGEEVLYTVKRVPRHIRPLKKGTGIKEEKEVVSLMEQNGLEYSQNQKETNRKIEEIVGLSKNQFMQVAMIAQGEFMEVLRADSNKKKEIFRKLFHTEFYQNIVEELKKRQKEKLKTIAQVKTACQTEVSHLVIWEKYENADELADVKRRILNSEKLNVADMEVLLKELQILCMQLEKETENAENIYLSHSKVRDAKRDAYTKAKTLLKSFEALEQARQISAECEIESGEIKRLVKLVEKITAAYEVKTEYQRYIDAKNIWEETKQKLKEQKEVLPDLQAGYEKAVLEERREKEEQEKELEAFTRVSERVEKALEVLKKIKEIEMQQHVCLEALKKAETEVLHTTKALQEKEQQMENSKKQQEELKDAYTIYELWKKKWEDYEGIKEEWKALQSIFETSEKQKIVVEKAQQEYLKAKRTFRAANVEYLTMQNAFLDAQAGFLAKEKLREGEPCPVCGSLSHPSPCILSEEHQLLTREMVEALAKKAEILQKAQADCATEAGAAEKLLQEKEQQCTNALHKLQEKMKKYLLEQMEKEETFSLEIAKKVLAEWEETLKAEGRSSHSNARTLKAVQEFLRNIEGELQKLREAKEKAVQKENDIKMQFASMQASYAELQKQKIFETQQEAEHTYVLAKKQKEEKDLSYKRVQKALLEVKTQKERAEAFIVQYQQELPEMEKSYEQREEAYERIRKEKCVSEMEWKQITQEYQKQEIPKYQEKIDAYQKKKALAEGAEKAALQAIGEQQKPEIFLLEKEMEEAEQQLMIAQKELEVLKEIYKTNREVYASLAPKMEERSQMTKEFTRIDSLYNRLAGKVSGARMDIETFVQRYYLQRILYSANIRFREMSAGQFELRMVNENQAGEGKNRGLDLMVYSAVNGKEREVKTLSGGESFMAALSLALGMADQIQEGTASVNLDMMFIDEGFGSLDDHSRNQAVKVLQQMSNGSKLIGIISHVTELKQEIEDQLLVKKDDEGSYVRWQIS